MVILKYLGHVQRLVFWPLGETSGTRAEVIIEPLGHVQLNLWDTCRATSGTRAVDLELGQYSFLFAEDA